MANLFCDEGEFENAHAHTKQVEEHILDDRYRLGRAMELRALIWYQQGRYGGGAGSEASRAVEIFRVEKLGATGDMDQCKDILWRIERQWKGSSDPSGKFLEMDPPSITLNFPFLVRGTPSSMSVNTH